MTVVVEGSDDGSGLSIGIAAAVWNQAVNDRLVDGALRRLEEMGVTDITVVRVPGALELPLAASKLAAFGCDAIIAIGTVVKGDTDHYQIVSTESSHGIARVSLDTGIPVANAILAVHDYSDAVDRAGPGDDNKGVEAATAAVEMTTALRSLLS